MTSQSTDMLVLSRPIAKCGVLYLGSAVSVDDVVGIESVQNPLQKRYNSAANSVYGVDAVLMVRENGVELSYTQNPSISLFYPIQALVYCASVRYTKQKPDVSRYGAPSCEMDGRTSMLNSASAFVPLDTAAANLPENQCHPPVFCIVFRRTRNIPAEECHCFITKTKQSAMVLVQSCFNAYSKQQELNPHSFSSVAQSRMRIPVYIKGTVSEQSETTTGAEGAGKPHQQTSAWYEVDQEHIRVIEAPTTRPVVDYMTNSQSIGFFYVSNGVTVDSWQLWEERKDEQTMVNSPTHHAAVAHKPNNKPKSYNVPLNPAHQRKSSVPTTNVISDASYHHGTNNAVEETHSDGSASVTPDEDETVEESGTSSPSVQDHCHEINNNATQPRPNFYVSKKTYGAVDPYEPAPNLVKVEHKRDPVTGANVFVRWFKGTNETDVQEDKPARPVKTAELPPTSANGPADKNCVVVREVVIRQNNDEENSSEVPLMKPGCSILAPEKKLEDDDDQEVKKKVIKSILRKNNHIKRVKSAKKITEKQVFDEDAYQITEAYFEDKKGKIHKVSKRRTIYEDAKGNQEKPSREKAQKSFSPTMSEFLSKVDHRRALKTTSDDNQLPIGSRIAPSHGRRSVRDGRDHTTRSTNYESTLWPNDKYSRRHGYGNRGDANRRHGNSGTVQKRLPSTGGKVKTEYYDLRKPMSSSKIYTLMAPTMNGLPGVTSTTSSAQPSIVAPVTTPLVAPNANNPMIHVDNHHPHPLHGAIAPPNPMDTTIAQHYQAAVSTRPRPTADYGFYRQATRIGLPGNIYSQRAPNPLVWQNPSSIQYNPYTRG